MSRGTGAWIPVAVFEHPSLKPSDKLVYGAVRLVLSGAESGVVFMEDLAKATGLGRRTVGIAIANLCSHGLLHKQRRGSLLVITCPKLSPTSAESALYPSLVSADSAHYPPLVSAVSAQQSADSAHTYKEKEKEKENRRPGDSYGERDSALEALSLPEEYEEEVVPTEQELRGYREVRVDGKVYFEPIEPPEEEIVRKYPELASIPEL